MRRWRLGILACFKSGKPCIRFFGCDVLAGRLVLFPDRENLSTQTLSIFFALHILLDGFLHQAVSWSLLGSGKPLQAGLDLSIQFQTRA